MIRNLLWIGPAFSIDEALGSKALAPAASRWQEGFLTAIQQAGSQVSILTHNGCRLWPRGPAYSAGSMGRFHGASRAAVPFVNLPACREFSLERSYRKAIDRLCADGSAPDLVASYNTWQPVSRACRYATRAHGIPWIPVLLDHVSPTPGWANVLAGVDESAGVVFVSHWAFVNAPLPRRLHLDAGVVNVPPLPMTRPRSRMVLYTGALHRWGGIETLLDAMPLVKTPSARLVVVGRGGSAEVMRKLQATPAVEYLGGVDEPTLNRLTDEAEVLANPRPAGVGGNEMNFPSKLLHYLYSLKPVATTLTPGVAPEYREVVIASEDDSPIAFAHAIDHAFGMTDADKVALAQKIRTFLGRDRLWAQQANRFLDWAGDLACKDAALPVERLR